MFVKNVPVCVCKFAIVMLNLTHSLNVNLGWCDTPCCEVNVFLLSLFMFGLAATKKKKKKMPLTAALWLCCDFKMLSRQNGTLSKLLYRTSAEATKSKALQREELWLLKLA